MYTSYFGNRKNVTNPLAITSGKPYWFRGPHYPGLGPKTEFLWDYKAGKIDQEEYTRQYMEQVLVPLSAVELYRELIRMYGEDITLLCWEKPPTFCHRYLVARWFEIELGVKVPELEFGPTGKRGQMSG